MELGMGVRLHVETGPFKWQDMYMHVGASGLNLLTTFSSSHKLCLLAGLQTQREDVSLTTSHSPLDHPLLSTP